MVTAAPQQQKFQVIAWMREPKLPGVFGKAVRDEWTFRFEEPTHNVASFEASRDRWLAPIDSATMSSTRFPHMVSEPLRAQAIDDARRAAHLIDGHAELANLQEIPKDWFFDREQVPVGMGKILIRSGNDTRTYLGKLDQMRGLLDITKHAVSTILDY